MILEFGPFAIDPLQRRLFHGARHVPLAAKPFELLLYLAENPGRIVDKDELLNALWKGISVTLPNITQTIFILRNVLRSRDPQPYIVTIPGKGYQLAAVVRKYKNGHDGLSPRHGAGHMNSRKAPGRSLPLRAF